MTTTTFAVYTMTPKGSFSQKYEGTDEETALKAYNKLVDANRPRLLSERVERNNSRVVMLGGGFPQ